MAKRKKIVTIVKVQRHLIGGIPYEGYEDSYLVSQKIKKLQRIQAVPKRVEAVIKKVNKAYFRAEFVTDQWRINERVPDEDW